MTRDENIGVIIRAMDEAHPKLADDCPDEAVHAMAAAAYDALLPHIQAERVVRLPVIDTGEYEVVTLDDWKEFARRDYCLIYLVPSDLRAILSNIDIGGQDDG